MRKVELKNVSPYQAPGHFGMTALKLHSKEDGSTNFIGLSHFLPGGGAEWDESPIEKVYFVLDGQVTIKTKDEEIDLLPYDSVHIAPNEGREIINKTNLPASMLVIVQFPE